MKRKDFLRVYPLFRPNRKNLELSGSAHQNCTKLCLQRIPTTKKERITEARKEPNASSLRLPRARCVPPRSGRCRRWYAARGTDEAAAASPGATGLCRTARAGHDEFERLLARLPTPHLRDGTGAHVRARARHPWPLTTTTFSPIPF